MFGNFGSHTRTILQTFRKETRHMFDCCTQRTKQDDGITRKISKRPMTPRRQQVQELARSLYQERRHHGTSLDEQLQRASTPVDTLFSGCLCGTESKKEDRTKTQSPLSTTQSPSVSMRSIAPSQSSPSSLARRKKSEPLPVPVEPVACDNFDCMTCQIQDDEWTVARLGARVFRFCSQECWTTWLENPGHLGSWSSPLLSYQTSPEMTALSPANSSSRSSYSSDGTPRQRNSRLNLLDLPPLMI